ncbi:Abi family protein [Neisseria sp. ZJ106]|uniref:Abi family protein n=1 Tax=Neisseria lisongii TaxID=2912188 RepID=A0ABY7RIS9_9NEIS|nr:Abi family protein [Neisseria lisongii]MCF7521003.1 Abi family protein [Neisseria lisongii]WCL71197.1 Abi family protein [Neisseria lisongii]
MQPPHPKIWLSFDQQLELLKTRGLHISDDAKATEYLARIGYYRLSGYFYAMRERNGNIIGDHFKSGAGFQDAVLLYIFDKKLRLLVLDALERIEIALRVDVSHHLGRLDKFAYRNPDLLHHSFSKTTSDQHSRHTDWLNKHEQLIKRSKEEFILHNKVKYGLPLPIWVACEVWDFGCLSTLFGGMKENDQDAVAQKYGIRNGRIFASWLRSLNYLRNICAHHSRLWNRNITVQPKLPPASDTAWVGIFGEKHKARCFLLLYLCRHLLKVINPQSSWPQRMKQHLSDFPDLTHLGLNLKGMGVPDDWENHWA